MSNDLPLNKKIHIGVFSQAQYMMSSIINTALLAFYTDYIGMENIATFGIAILVFGIWNAINDPLFGYLSDKRISQGGLRIPLMKKGMPLMLIGFLMTILVVPGWEDWKIFVLLLIGLIIFDFGKALSMVNYGAYLITIADSPQKRSKLNLVVSYVGLIPGALIGIVPTVFLTGKRFSYGVVLGVFLGITISFYILSQYSLLKMPETREMYERDKKHEDVIDEKSEPLNRESIVDYVSPEQRIFVEGDGEIFSLRESFSQTVHSKPFQNVVLYRFLAAFFQATTYLNIIYIMSWVVIANEVWVILITGLGGLVINVLYPFLNKWRKKYGTISVLKGTFYVAIPGYTIMFFTNSLWLLFLGYGLSCVGLSGLNLFDPVLLGDVADNDFIETKTHKQGIFVSVHGFFITLASSFSVFILTIILEVFGYDGKAAFQTDQAILGIRLAAALLPLIAIILCIIVLSVNPLQGERYQKLRMDLAEIYGVEMLDNEETKELFLQKQKEKKKKNY